VDVDYNSMTIRSHEVEQDFRKIADNNDDDDVRPSMSKMTMN